MRREQMMRAGALALPLALLARLVAGQGMASAPSQPRTPVWNDKQMADYRLPLAGLGKPPTLVAAHDYYALPEANLKTYPVYTPDKEPPGYIDSLKQLAPAPLVDLSEIKTDADWIAAGREVFFGRELPRFTGSEHNLQLIRNPQVLKRYNLPTTKDGVILGLRYVVRAKGNVELGTDTCAMCHVQVRPDGQVIEGAANNQTPFGPLMGDLTRIYAKMSPEMMERTRRRNVREDYRVPFLKDDPNQAVAELPAEAMAALYDQHPLGVQERSNTSLLYPVKIANLIGVGDLRYLDRTGTSRQRSLTDLMRYCGLVGDVTDALTHYGDGPNAALNLPNMGLPEGIRRTPDPMLYALARYLTSLKPPINSNPKTALTRRGETVFKRAGCNGCHTAPLYTNNKLTLAEGFTPPGDLLNRVDAMPFSVGTDPNLALKTRKGTGFYRVPSLRMVWLYNAFLHDGSLGTLEEMLDPKRLQPDFRASNWAPTAVPRAVKGHEFGLDLPAEDKMALVAFLKTL